MRYLAVLNKDPDSDYGVHFPDFPGCITAGSTIEEAHAMAEEALNFYIEDMKKDGEPLPVPSTYEEIIKEPTNRGIAFFEVDVIEEDPPLKLYVTLPESIVHALSAKSINPSDLLTQAAREKLHLNTAGKHA